MTDGSRRRVKSGSTKARRTVPDWSTRKVPAIGSNFISNLDRARVVRWTFEHSTANKHSVFRMKKKVATPVRLKEIGCVGFKSREGIREVRPASLTLLLTALGEFYEMTIGIAQEGPYLVAPVNWRRQELGSA